MLSTSKLISMLNCQFDWAYSGVEGWKLGSKISVSLFASCLTLYFMKSRNTIYVLFRRKVIGPSHNVLRSPVSAFIPYCF